MTLRGRVKKTLWNVGFVLNEMKSGRAADLANEELDMRRFKSAGLAHGAVIAAATLVFVGHEPPLHGVSFPPREPATADPRLYAIDRALPPTLA
jgi:hypothetical protein